MVSIKYIIHSLIFILFNIEKNEKVSFLLLLYENQ